MKTLIIHPDDRSTDLLKSVYKNLNNTTIITGGVSVEEVHQQIEVHDRVIMVGHGTPSGLMAMRLFTNSTNSGNGMTPFYVIDDSIVQALAQKENNIYIWCYASDFVKRHHLKGFCSGMFISEVLEANMMGVLDQSQAAVDAQFDHFCNLVGTVAHLPAKEIYKYVTHEYGKMTNHCPISKYNHERLWLGV